MKSKPAKGRNANGTPALELYLSRNVFATGKRLSGVVVLRLNKPTNIRSLSVIVDGAEVPSVGSLVRAFGKGGAFFERETVLSGALQPKLASDRMSLLWNGMLGRYTGRTLSAGEHTYPFSVALPASLPPSYDGRAGKIEYKVTARLQPAAGRVTKVSHVVPVVFVPRQQRGRPVAVSYPNTDGTVHSTEISVDIELPERLVAMGTIVNGRFRISNPHEMMIPRVTVSLDVCEFVGLSANKEIHRDRVDVSITKPQEPEAELIEGSFALRAPKNASPSIEGTAISVIWLLKLTLETDPPIEFKTPITVFAPLD